MKWTGRVLAAPKPRPNRKLLKEVLWNLHAHALGTPCTEGYTLGGREGGILKEHVKY